MKIAVLINSILISRTYLFLSQGESVSAEPPNARSRRHPVIPTLKCFGDFYRGELELG